MEIYLDNDFYNKQEPYKCSAGKYELIIEPFKDVEMGKVFNVYFRNTKFVALMNSYIVTNGDKIRFLKPVEYLRYKKGKINLCWS